MSITSTTPGAADNSWYTARTAQTGATTPPVDATTGFPLGGQASRQLPRTTPSAQNPLATGSVDRTSRRTTDPRVSVVMPTCNEARNLPRVLGRIPPAVHEVIIVDGHSIDDTVEVARFLRPDVKVVLQNRFGRGNAMACGFAAVTGDVVVTVDPDGSTDPAEIPRFVAALVDGADFAKGTRFPRNRFPGDAPRSGVGYRCLNWLANVLFHTSHTDLCYSYNAFWRDCLSHLALDPGPRESVERVWGDGFETETVINARAAKAGLRIAEVRTSPNDRARLGQTWRDGARVVRALLVERLNGVARAPGWVNQPAGTMPAELPREVGETGA